MKKINICLTLIVLIFSCACSGASAPTNVENDGNNNDDDNDPSVPVATAILADHTSVTAFDEGIPDDYAETAVNDLHVFYGHTSHGSQLVTGLGMIDSPDSTSLDILEDDTIDLGHLGSTDWVSVTEAELDADSSINVVLWSWCGGVADNTEEGINTYLTAMNQLENDYPDVTFVYMTGRHWNEDGSAQVDGESAATNDHIEEMNNLIRDYAANNDKVLYDFHDIEEYSPDGTRYSDTSDGCSWCSDWCDSHPDEEGCLPEYADTCAHTHPYNCYVKGKVLWWLLSRIAGWEG